MANKQGKIIIVCAPSGSGKSTLEQYLMAQSDQKIEFSVSATSRPPRGSERNGVEYFFLSPDEFHQKIAENAFVEYEEVYENCFYGTLKSEVDNKLSKGANLLFDVDVKGGLNIKRMYGDRALALFVQPPSTDELRRRLVGRATDSPEMIEKRLTKATWEMQFAPQFDAVIVNDDLATAQTEILNIVTNFLNK
ncbi:MAG: guanylate kinase [Paludibacteraceae bacterium]